MSDERPDGQAAPEPDEGRDGEPTPDAPPSGAPGPSPEREPAREAEARDDGPGDTPTEDATAAHAFEPGPPAAAPEERSEAPASAAAGEPLGQDGTETPAARGEILPPEPRADEDDPLAPADGAGLPMETMTLVEHLRELRTRLLWSVGAVLLGMLLGLTVSREVMSGLTEMCTACGDFQTIAPLEGFVTYFRVALILGLVLATPVILYQVVRFVLPALHRHEKRYLLYLLPGASLLFVVGLLFGYYIVLPRTINFLAGFLDFGGDVAGADGTPIAESQWRLSLYIAFVTNLLLILGLAFQTPLVVYLLAKLGVVSTDLLRTHRKHAVLLLAVLAAVLTPTPDPFTMLMVLLPMYLLYELGIVLARVA